MASLINRNSLQGALCQLNVFEDTVRNQKDTTLIEAYFFFIGYLHAFVDNDIKSADVTISDDYWDEMQQMLTSLEA